MPLLLTLLIPTILFADAGFQLQETMSNVMYIPNVNDTLDSDDDGIPAWRELKSVIDSIGGVLGEICYTCSLETRYIYNSANYPQATLLDCMSGFLDTNRLWVPYTGVQASITSGDDYILTKLATCARAAEAATGAYPKYFCFGPGMPRWIRPNSDPPRDDDPNSLLLGAQYDSCVAKSLCDFVEIYYRPNIDTVWESDVSYAGYWGSRYIEAARGASQKGFTSGIYRQYKANLGEASDSTLQWVICTQIDGFDDNDICNMMRKAYAGRYAAWEPDGTPNYWGVVDMQEADDLGGVHYFFAPFYSQSFDYPLETTVTNSSLWHYCEGAFGSNLLFDLFVDLIDTSDTPDDTLSATVGGNPDTCSVYFGYLGAHTLAVGDSAVFYFTPASYHPGGSADDGSPIPTSICYETDLSLAHGSFMFTPESWNGYTIRDTALRSGTSDDQTLMVEWLDNGGMNATYGVGHTREVGSATQTVTTEQYVVDAMFSPEVPFAVASELCTGNKAQNIAMGWPSFAWREAEAGVGSAASFAGSCDEVFSFSSTSPADADSYLVYLEYDNDSTSTIRVNTAPSSAVNYSIGTRWLSKGLSAVTVIYKDIEGNLHPEPIFQP